jgi:hypothetical protein
MKMLEENKKCGRPDDEPPVVNTSIILYFSMFPVNIGGEITRLQLKKAGRW